MRKNNLMFNPEIDLIRGNINYASKIDGELLKKLSEEGQRPQAIVVSCSDSRVPVEVIFDALEPGELFVIRAAGNVVYGPVVVGSIEFAIRQLKTPNVVLLGHTGCGAVQASIEATSKSDMEAQLCSQIRCNSKDLNKAVIENLEHQFKNILEIECVQKGIAAGSLRAYAMIYYLHTGKVEVLRRVAGLV